VSEPDKLNGALLNIVLLWGSLGRYDLEIQVAKKKKKKI
jgi:hypothetical protein